MRRIYKGSEITHSMYLPVKDVDNLSYLSITLHTHSDNDVIKSYPEDVTYRAEDGEFVFTLSSDDIVTLQEGIVWATADFREITEEFPDGYDFTKRYQLPYYIKWSEGAISPVVISEEDVRRVVEETLQEYFTQEEISIIVEEIVRNILTEEEITRIIEETVTEEEIRRIIEEHVSEEEITRIIEEVVEEKLSEEEIRRIVEEIISDIITDEHIKSLIEEIMREFLDEEYIRSIIEEIVSEEEIRSIIENIVNEILSEESIRTFVEEIVNELLSEERITEIVTEVVEEYFSQEEIRTIIEETITEIVTEEKLTEIIEEMISEGELREIIEQIVTEKLAELHFKTINGESIVGEGNIEIISRMPAYSSFEKLGDWIYKLTYNDLDYDYSSEYLDQYYDSTIGACTSLRKGQFLGRNLDWYYSDLAEFVIKTKANQNRHATICIGGNIPTLTKDFVESRAWSERYTTLPFTVVDGINDAGVAVSVNVVATLGVTPTTSTNPGKERLSGMMIPRFVLDNFDNAEDAVNEIATNRDVYMPHSDALQEEFHYIIADATSTYILEFSENEAVIIDKSDESHALMTNFRLDGVQFDSSNHIIPSTVEDYGMGVERFDLLTDSFANMSTTNKTSILNLLKSVAYTKAYTEEYSDGLPLWKTEFTGQYSQEDLKVSSSRSSYRRVFGIAQSNYEDRTRENPITWQSEHTSIYDIDNKKLYLYVQEDFTKEFSFDFTSEEGGSGSDYDDTELRERIEDLENIDHSQFLTEHQTLKTINNQSLVGTGNITIQGGGSSYDDTEIRQLIEQLQTKVEALEEIDHSQFLTEHQTLKTINNQSLVGTGNISIPEADYDVLMSALNNL